MPTAAFAQLIPGSPFGAGGGGGAGSSPPFTDTDALVKGSADPTKLLRFEVDGFTGGATRVMTPPNSDGTLAILGLAQSFTAAQTFSGSVIIPDDQGLFFGAVAATVPGIRVRTEQNPDALVIGTGNLSNGVIFGENTDAAVNRAIPLMTNPAMHYVPASTSTTERTSVMYAGFHGRAIKTLTESAATSVLQVPVAASAGVGGTITFTAFAADATDQQTLTGVLQYAAVNKAGTETCATPTLTGTALNSVSTGTLTCTYACDTSPANAVNIQFNCASSLTQTTLDLYYRVDALGASEPLPQ
jgi:hypothetical protein